MKSLVIMALLLATTINQGFAMTSTRSIQKVKAENEQALMDMPCVVSVGIGLAKDGQPAIIVGLDSPCPETTQNLPAEINGYPVETHVTGKARAQ